MVTISEPLKEVAGGGKNAKHIRECTELYMGGKGIEKIRGFEPFVNLEVLWLNNNKLKKVNNLDTNFRIKVLCVQDNQICTLKGSLLSFKFLEHLDMSNNVLRDLDKILSVLIKFKFLNHLNLKDNPCCEEPNYRLITITRLKGLVVLDQHVVTPAERDKVAVETGSAASRNVAFGAHIPAGDSEWEARVPERSILEQELGRDAETIREKLMDESVSAERQLFAATKYAEYPKHRKSLPANAGTVRAMAQWASMTADLSTTMPGANSSSQSTPPQLSNTSGSTKDVLVLYSCRPNPDAIALAHTTPPEGLSKKQQKKFEQTMLTKATGARGQWELVKTVTEIGN